jgi:hypothetical protein
MPAANRNRGHIPLKDYYSVADVSALLGIGENEVRRLAGRPDDPPPVPTALEQGPWDVHRPI